MKVALVNGQERAVVSIEDRGLLYGDGLFETIAVRGGAPCRWSAHFARMARGAERLGIPCPDAQLIRSEVDALVDGIEHAVLRLTLTRGGGGRGYRAPDVQLPTRILALYPSPAPEVGPNNSAVQLRLCHTRLGENPLLAGIKHLNRLEQVLARSEWQRPEITDGLMTDYQGHLICGTMTNVFLVFDDGIVTPALDRCGVVGTTRSLVFECAAVLGIPLAEREVPSAELWRAQALFVTNSLLGMLPVARLESWEYDDRAVPAPLLARVNQGVFQPEMPT
ncbi:MAG: aminodeoxychorismate lyase [Thiohalocapsa sp. PB-PSB1]|nr:MAG: hypothetical protein N838_12350 [Thiohalocapsa sp. PB-PSB1]QQO52669.1 MAG: aminodeoxychorismate lyase [Thiohalocapsa sp. PB-PSB1]